MKIIFLHQKKPGQFQQESPAKNLFLFATSFNYYCRNFNFSHYLSTIFDYQKTLKLWPETEQKQLFEEQLLLALKYDLPVIIHCRDAYEDIFYKISSVIGEIEETYSPTNGKAFITIVIIKFDSQSCDQIQELRYSYLCPDFMMPYCFKSVPVLTNCNREEKRLSFSCDKLEENERQGLVIRNWLISIFEITWILKLK